MIFRRLICLSRKMGCHFINALHRLLQIGSIGERWIAGILHTDEFYACQTMRYGDMLVHQLLPTQLALEIIEHLAITLQGTYRMIVVILAIIMIAPNGINAIRRIEFL